MASRKQSSLLNHDAPTFVPGSQHLPSQPRIGQFRNDQGDQVDAWRSYRSDQTNLQTSVGPGNTLSASSPDVEPYMQTLNATTTQAHPSFKPYQPLRFSNGVKEREALKNVTRTMQTVSQELVPSHRYDLRSRNAPRHDRRHAHKAAQDRSVPSIEPSDPLPTAPAQDLEVLKRHYKRETTSQRTASPAAPTATDRYLSQAQLLAARVETPRKLLVILDLNGTLGIKKLHHNPKSFMIRPGVPHLLNYLFDNHVVMIYTSSQPHNATVVVNNLLSTAQRPKLAALWGRDRLDLTREQYRDKVQVYKKLDKVWADHSIQATHAGDGKWDQSNTILVDDSHLKALAQPHNLLQVPEFLRKAGAWGQHGKKAAKREEEILQSLIVKLESLKYQADVSQLIWRWQTGQEDIPRVPDAAVTVEEKVTTKDLAAEKHTQQSKGAENDIDDAVEKGDGLDDGRSDDDNEGDAGARLTEEVLGSESTAKPNQIPGLRILEQTTLTDRTKKQR